MADPVVTSHHAISPPAAPSEDGAEPSEIKFSLDGKQATAKPGEFLISAAERNGVYIPRFCYHSRMKPVGMCRMCLVEVNGPRGASLQPACYLPVAENMEVVTTSDNVQKAQNGVLELLLVNHPLDCPVCDKGGECPLQDQTMSYGPGETRFLEEKRHWAKPIPISDLVLLDRERCIQCGRCVRFAAEIAGEAQIDFAGRGDRTEVAIFEDQPFESYFAGNTVQICPVGALTATPYRFTARPWDLDQVESTCTTCSVGCRVAVQSSANRATRVLGIDSDPVNQSWLCDKGRFAIEAVNSEDRVTEPLIRRTDRGEFEVASWNEALSLVADRIKLATSVHGGSGVGFIGGARLSNEDAYAWAKLAKSVVGTDSVDAQIGDGLPADFVLGLPRATVDEVCASKVVVVLAGDIREEVPVLFLRLRAAALDGGASVIELGSKTSSISSFATSTILYRPGEAEAVAEALVSGGPAPHGVDSSMWQAALDAIASAGDGAVSVILGRPSVAEHESIAASAGAKIAKAWPNAKFLPVLRRGNVFGAIDMGLAPGVLPGRVSLEAGKQWFESAWGSVPDSKGLDTEGILKAASEGSLHALVLIGADPLSDFPDAALAEGAIDQADFVVAIDSFISPSSARADVVLPAVMHNERSGTTTNFEGRVTRVGQKLVAPGQCRPDWMIAVELAELLGGELGFSSVSEIWDEIAEVSPSHTGVTRSVLSAPSARDGVVVPLSSAPVKLGRRGGEIFDPVATPGIDSVERQGAPPRAGTAEPVGYSDISSQVTASTSGNRSTNANGKSKPSLLGTWKPGTAPALPPPDGYSLRLLAPHVLYDAGRHFAASPGLHPLAKSAVVKVNPLELDRLGVSSGDIVRVKSSRGDLLLHAISDPGVPQGVASIDFNQPAVDASDGPDIDSAKLVAGGPSAAATLIDSNLAVVDVRLESVR